MKYVSELKVGEAIWCHTGSEERRILALAKNIAKVHCYDDEVAGMTSSVLIKESDGSFSLHSSNELTINRLYYSDVQVFTSTAFV